MVKVNRNYFIDRYRAERQSRYRDSADFKTVCTVSWVLFGILGVLFLIVLAM